MYYLKMETAVEFNLKSKTFSQIESFAPLKEKNTCLVNIKFYQNLLFIIISLSTFLIFPESPKELESICEQHYSRKLCNVL